MRLTGMRLRGFRGFIDEHWIDLDADVVIIHGPNGQGKTSLFDAVSWCLTGTVPRFHEFEDLEVSSRFVADDGAHVELDWRDADQLGTVIREEAPSRVQLLLNDESWEGQAAIDELSGLVGAGSSNTVDLQLAARGFYLEQDAVRDFLIANSNSDRFAALGSLLGTGRLIELKGDLEAERRSWTSDTNALHEERGAIAERMQDLDGRRAALESELERSHQVDPVAWDAWWGHASGRISSSRDRPSVADRDALARLEAALGDLRQRVTLLERREAELEELRSLVVELGETPTVELVELEEVVQAAKASRQAAQDELDDATRRAAEVDSERRRLAEEQRSLRLLAESALIHLGTRCPVCQQDYDRQETTARLRDLLETAPDLPEEPDITPIRELAEGAREELAAAESALQAAQAQHARRQHHLKLIRQRAEALLGDVSEVDLELPIVDQSHRDLIAERAELQDLLRQGELLAGPLSRVGQQEAVDSLHEQLLTARQRLDKLDTEISRREKIRDLASHMIDRLRVVAETLVQDELEKLNPLLEEIYRAVDPHPAFRELELAARTFRGDGRLWPKMRDSVSGVPLTEEGEIATVLSSSQINVTALAVFLSMNLRVPPGRVRLVGLDDPIQSLDDLNVLGFLDLLRRLRDQRQILISTHDERFVRLLARKLRPVGDEHRTLVYEITDWSRQGPHVRMVEVPQDLARTRLTA